MGLGVDLRDKGRPPLLRRWLYLQHVAHDAVRVSSVQSSVVVVATRLQICLVECFFLSESPDRIPIFSL